MGNTPANPFGQAAVHGDEDKGKIGGGCRLVDPNRTSVNWPPLTVLRPFHVDGIRRMQHLFLCLEEQEVGNSATVSIIPRERLK